MLSGHSEVKYSWLGNHGNSYRGNVRLLYVTRYNPTNNATVASMGKVSVKVLLIFFFVILGYEN